MKINKLFITFILCTLFSPQLWAAFSVNGTQLLDGNGQPFIMRGVNHPHAWYSSDTAAAIPDIAATGANVVRVVLSNGTHAEGWTKTPANEVADIIELCKANNLITMLEVHDVTGSGDNTDAGDFADAVAYWIEIKDTLIGEEDYVLINLANEPFGNGVAANVWTDEHVAGIQALRDEGLTHTLVVDAANWGQDWSGTMMDNAQTVAAADSLANTIFSVHMYEVYGSASAINNYIDDFLDDNGLPLIVGEFGPVHNSQNVDEDTILAKAEEVGIGYIGWSWSGNGSCCVDLDLVNGFDAGDLTTWGERLINGTNGIAETSVLATVFTGLPSSSSSSSSSTSSSTSTSSSSSSSSSSSGRPAPVEVSASGSNSGSGSFGLGAILLLLTVCCGLSAKTRKTTL